ncbi:MAG: hypothetical protein IRZ02_01645 [Acidothermus sp.]|nr:hypothetical protein [Acidothermus sp.]MCL6538269.1 DUF6458 family protein [Acidothermus sp.]
MGIGAAIFLIAVGAILTFAVHASVSGVSLQTIGIILMVVGAIGLLVVLTVFTPRRRTRVIESGPVSTRERIIERDDI